MKKKDRTKYGYITVMQSLWQLDCGPYYAFSMSYFVVSNY